MLNYLKYILSFYKGILNSFLSNNVKISSPALNPIVSNPTNNKSEKLSEHFSFEELTITEEKDLIEENRKEAENFKDSLTKVAKELLEPIRIGLNLPVRITSGYRGKTLNERVGGSLTSQHCKGEAADFEVQGYDTREKRIEVIKWIVKQGFSFGQLLLERNIIHISLGTKKEIAEYTVDTKKKIPLQLS